MKAIEKMKIKSLCITLILVFLPVACVPATTLSPDVTLTSTIESTVAPTNHIVASVTPGFNLEEVRARVLELLKNNNGCELPCFWGISVSSQRKGVMRGDNLVN
jgi:hypothetical protein